MNGRDVLGESGKNIIKAYSKEIYLWENPFDAPEVPPESFWKKFFENSDKIEADMPGISEQIEKKVNCRRAEMKLKAENDPLFQEIFGKVKDSLFAVDGSETKYESSSENDSDLLPRFFPRKGDIFYTQGKLPVINKNGRISFVYTFKPCAVLLLNDGEEMEWDDIVFRCAVVTPECVGKAVESQDMLLENGWILHKWLNYPLSLDQIDLTKKVGSIDNIDEIAVTVEKYSSSDEKMIRYGKEEKRLKACAEYLPIMADTKKAVFEMNETDSVKWAAGYTTDTDTSTMIVKKGDGGETVCLTAKLTDPIFLSKETKADDLPTWIFSLKDVCIPEGKEFVLRDAKDENIGYGIIRHAKDHGVARLVEYFPEKLESDITNAAHVFLLVDISE